MNFETLKENKTSNKFNLYDRVTNSGKVDEAPIIIGNIIGIVESSFFKEILYGNRDTPVWDETFVNWKNKPVYVVLLDTMTPVITREAAVKQGVAWEEVTRTNVQACAEDDLIKYEDKYI